MNTQAALITKRERLIDAAAVLFHRRGMFSTSLADIAKHAEIPIGNVYYYFKTKDDLALAVLEKHTALLRTLCSKIDAEVEDPRMRLIEAVRFFDRVKDEYARYGCPIFRMVMDGVEMERDTVSVAAGEVYEHFLQWLEQQFRALGHAEGTRDQALIVLAGIQGGATLARAFREPAMMVRELNRLEAWLQQVPNKRIFLGKGAKKVG